MKKTFKDIQFFPAMGGRLKSLTKFDNGISSVRMRDMKKVIIYILVALGLWSIGLLTMMGEVQKLIKFQDPLNEMLFSLIFFVGGILSLMNIKKQ